MTPAVKAARDGNIEFSLIEYDHDPTADSYGLEAASRIGQPSERVFKTLVAKLDGVRLAVAIVPVGLKLDLKALAAALGAKRAVMAEALEAQRATGFVVGGISPLGQRRQLPTVLDESALGQERIFVSGGRRGLEIALAPSDLIRLCDARLARIGR